MAEGDTEQTSALRAFLQILTEAQGASGVALLGFDTSDNTLMATEAYPADLAGKRIPMIERFPQLADRGSVAAGAVALPAILTRWLGGRPAVICLHTLHLPGHDGYLLLCWPVQGPDDQALRRAIRGATSILSDLIDRQRLAAENRRQATRLQAILDNVDLGIAISDEQGRVHLNPIAAALLGLPDGTIDSASLAAAMRHLREQGESDRAIDLAGVTQSASAEYWMLPAATGARDATGTGAKRVIHSVSHPVGDSVNPGRIWLFRDVTALWRSSERLKLATARLQARETELAEELHLQKQELESSKRESDYLANHDPLTGLNNRRAFRHALQQMIDVARGTRGQVAVLFIDLDKFKAVNDTLGHDAGDQLLKKVADILNDALRDTDLLARFGGDEFAIATRISGSSDLAKITGLAERIRQKLEIPVPAPSPETPGNAIQICGTIGIALYPGDAADIDTLFIRADQAMYKGKKTGRNRVVMFSELAVN